jgi:hypothetical protein
MSSLNNAAANSDVGTAILIVAACYGALAEDADKRLAEQQVMRVMPLDLMMTVDCGLEFGPI